MTLSQKLTSCKLAMPRDKKECVLCAALWNEREVFKYIRTEVEPMTEVITTKFQGTLHIEADASNWKDMTKILSKALVDEKELRKTLSKLGGQSLTKQEVKNLTTKKRTDFSLRGRKTTGRKQPSRIPSQHTKRSHLLLGLGRRQPGTWAVSYTHLTLPTNREV